MLVEVWSELHCPWALVAVARLRAAKARMQEPVVLAPRSWPLEWVNGSGTPRTVVTTEVAALASHEPDLFRRFDAASWPSTFLPAYELVAAARRVGGETWAEEVDFAVRLAFFRDSVDVSIEAGLREALRLATQTAPEIDVSAVLEVWRRQNVRADVHADYERSRTLPIQGSPHIFWPDGTNVHNPGMTDHEWVGELVRIGVTDRDLPGALLRRQAAASR